MNRFLEIVEEELARQKKRMAQCEKQLVRAPKGYLKSRSRKKGASFYHGSSAMGRSFEQNITEDLAMVEELLKKKSRWREYRRAMPVTTMLKNLDYCIDDPYGNCSSLYIDKMIREHLLPFYRKQSFPANHDLSYLRKRLGERSALKRAICQIIRRCGRIAL